MATRAEMSCRLEATHEIAVCLPANKKARRVRSWRVHCRPDGHAAMKVLGSINMEVGVEKEAS